MNSATEDGSVVYESMHTLYHQQTNTIPHCVLLYVIIYSYIYIYLCHDMTVHAIVLFASAAQNISR